MGKNKSTRNVTIRLPHEDVALLDRLALESGWTRHALLVHFVQARCQEIRDREKKN